MKDRFLSKKCAKIARKLVVSERLLSCKYQASYLRLNVGQKYAQKAAILKDRGPTLEHLLMNLNQSMQHR
jgi:hypothetical protein